MLARLLEVNNTDPMSVEETRMRAATLLCKVFKTYSITPHIFCIFIQLTHVLYHMSEVKNSDQFTKAESCAFLSQKTLAD